MTLLKGNTELSKDTRPIEAVYFTDGEGGFLVGAKYRNGEVTGIEAYDESGHMANIPWVAVFMDGKLAVRVPADRVSIHYVQ